MRGRFGCGPCGVSIGGRLRCVVTGSGHPDHVTTQAVLSREFEAVSGGQRPLGHRPAACAALESATMSALNDSLPPSAPSRSANLLRWPLVALLGIGLGFGMLLTPQGDRADAAQDISILVFSKTEGFRHASIAEGTQAVRDIGTNNGWSVDATEDAGAFTTANLSQYDAVVFLSTTGNVLDDQQEAAFEEYIQAGGGYAGVHAASDTEYDWAWYGDLVGAYFDRHPAVQQATIEVEDTVHASTDHLADEWVRTDEWYDFRDNPRGDVHVLATLDEGTYDGGLMGPDHPIAWCHAFDGGRSWYTAGGHTAASYGESDFVEHLEGGIAYAAGVGGGCGNAGPTPTPTVAPTPTVTPLPPTPAPTPAGQTEPPTPDPGPTDPPPTEPSPGDSRSVVRVSGEDRIATAVAASQSGWEGAETAVIATAGDFADALAAVPLAGDRQAPLLLTGPAALDDRVLGELDRLGVGEVILMGGTAALGVQVERSLQGAGLTVERIAGMTRTGTADAASAALGRTGEPRTGSGWLRRETTLPMPSPSRPSRVSAGIRYI